MSSDTKVSCSESVEITPFDQRKKYDYPMRYGMEWDFQYVGPVMEWDFQYIVAVIAVAVILYFIGGKLLKILGVLIAAAIIAAFLVG